MTFESRVPRRDTQVTDTSDSRGGPAIDHGKNRAPRRTFRRWRGILGKDETHCHLHGGGGRGRGEREAFESIRGEGDHLRNEASTRRGWEVILGCWCGEWTEERRILGRGVDGGIVWMEVRETGFIGLWLCRMGIARRANNNKMVGLWDGILSIIPVFLPRQLERLASRNLSCLSRIRRAVLRENRG